MIWSLLDPTLSSCSRPGTQIHINIAMIDCLYIYL